MYAHGMLHSTADKCMLPLPLFSHLLYCCSAKFSLLFYFTLTSKLSSLFTAGFRVRTSTAATVVSAFSSDNTQIVTFHQLQLNSSEGFITLMLTINPGNHNSECYPRNMFYSDCCVVVWTEQSLMYRICSVIWVMHHDSFL